MNSSDDNKHRWPSIMFRTSLILENFADKTAVKRKISRAFKEFSNS